jgi:hypothetical protein
MPSEPDDPFSPAAEPTSQTQPEPAGIDGMRQLLSRRSNERDAAIKERDALRAQIEAREQSTAEASAAAEKSRIEALEAQVAALAAKSAGAQLDEDDEPPTPRRAMPGSGRFDRPAPTSGYQPGDDVF